MDEVKAYEVTTAYVIMGVCKRVLQRYIVAATSPGKAALAVDLKDGEEVLEAKELRSHKFVIAK